MSTVRIKRKHVLDSDSDDDDDAPSASVAVASVSIGSSEKENTVREKATTTQKGSSPHSPSRAAEETRLRRAARGDADDDDKTGSQEIELLAERSPEELEAEKVEQAKRDGNFFNLADSQPVDEDGPTMSTQSATWISVSLTIQLPIFDPHLDIATVVFSHVQCVKTRHSLARVSKLWRDASKPAAAYPLRFDFGAFPRMPSCTRSTHVTGLLDNDEALSLPYERVVGLLGETGEYVCDYAAYLGSVRLLKWTRENNLVWSASTCHHAAYNGHLPALQYLRENGCPWDGKTCYYAALSKRWDCLQYLVDNKCMRWEIYAKKYAEHLR